MIVQLKKIKYKKVHKGKLSDFNSMKTIKSKDLKNAIGIYFINN